MSVSISSMVKAAAEKDGALLIQIDGNIDLQGQVIGRDIVILSAKPNPTILAASIKCKSISVFTVDGRRAVVADENSAVVALTKELNKLKNLAGVGIYLDVRNAEIDHSGVGTILAGGCSHVC